MIESAEKLLGAAKAMISATGAGAPTTAPATGHRTYNINEGGGAHLSEQEDRELETLMIPDPMELQRQLELAVQQGRMTPAEATEIKVRNIIDTPRGN